jgi:hypothetical protein
MRYKNKMLLGFRIDIISPLFKISINGYSFLNPKESHRKVQLRHDSNISMFCLQSIFTYHGLGFGQGIDKLIIFEGFSLNLFLK